MIVLKPPGEPEDDRPFEEQLLEAMMRPLPEHTFLRRGEYPAGTDSATVRLWLQGYKVENADVNEDYL